MELIDALNVRAADTAPIPDNVLRSRILRKSVKLLLQSSCSGWMRRYVEMNAAAALGRLAAR
jgi:hypothetical protein